MADFAFNIAKGRTVELYNRVKGNDPAASAFYLIPVDVAAVSDATLKDLDDFAAIITAGVTERAASNWNRKTITDAELAAFPAPNDAGDSYDVDMPDVSWNPGPTAGAVTDLILCYASVATPTNAQLMPVAQYDFPEPAPSGAVVNGIVDANGFYRAS